MWGDTTIPKASIRMDLTFTGTYPSRIILVTYLKYSRSSEYLKIFFSISEIIH
jgi:hypothetical protein